MSQRLAARSSIAGMVQGELRAMSVQFPGVVMSYDPAQQRAEVQPLCRRRREIEGVEIEERLPLIPSVLVMFPGSGKFEVIWDIERGDRGWVECSQDALDDWLTNGEEAPSTPREPFALHDAVFTPGIRDFGHPRVACPKGVMRIGAVDGPQIIWDLNTHSLEARSLNDVKIVGKTQVRIDSDGGVWIQGRYVDPDGGDI